MSDITNSLVARYVFDDEKNIGRDQTDNQFTAIPSGKKPPVIDDVDGRKAAVFCGGANGTSYICLPREVLCDVGDRTGITISAWVYEENASSVWERIADFGAGMTGPYLFLTRGLRGVCFAGEDIAADPGKGIAEHRWTHVAFTVSGTENGSKSSAGPRIYVDGELVSDGMISQTSSGTYKSFRAWWNAFENMKEAGLYIGKSQFEADPDFCGAMSDFRIYKKALSEEEILAMMCDSLSNEEILHMAKEKFLPKLPHILPENQTFADNLMDGRVSVIWSSNPEGIINDKGILNPVEKTCGATIRANLYCDGVSDQKEYKVTILAKEDVASEITIHGNDKVLDISKTLYGLFFEDINHSADGGIYAELIQNRSFEEFVFDTYNYKSGENGSSTGRIHNPLKYWFGDTDKVTVKSKGGLNEFFSLSDPDANSIYVIAQEGATLINRGFCDENLKPSIPFRKGETYRFTIWAKANENATITVTLLNDKDEAISKGETISVLAGVGWKKYSVDELIAEKTGLGQVAISFSKTMAVDMISLMPHNVWGANEAIDGFIAHSNYMANSNYRLRRDLVQVLKDMHPSFLRFPGGCISEGSYIWENVYDWKDSVGPVECRKENFNVWGYTMTMGLGYMEYFQLAEDLNAEPLPVMACGVLCQARSDYANPAGGSLREKYVQNFLDLIDFAISTDFDGNRWAALRKEMGHEKPFGLHYLGVGNENWGTEFFANFEVFYERIDRHMKETYPGYELTIISTAGAQADDNAYQDGWKFLAGGQTDRARIAFSDGEESKEEEVSWYSYKKNYLDTIVDEHYYRSNEYLLENVDRYNYYYRPDSKVFVGEYASSDKNTLAGAVAEAAVMTGFENNSDVVRLAATAPLFNKVGTDGTYRWTPDCIWFDDETVWRTPNYYVQQLFASYLGDKLLRTGYKTYVNGEKKEMTPHGDVAVFLHGNMKLQSIRVTASKSQMLLFEQKFDEPQKEELIEFKGGYYIRLKEGDDTNYEVTVCAKCLEDGASFSVAAGITGDVLLDGTFCRERVSMHEYCIGAKEYGTGLKVYKDGKEGYTMGDYSSSVYAGNLRRFYLDELKEQECYQATVNFGGMHADCISGFYTNIHAKEPSASFEAKLSYYNRDIMHSVTEDDDTIYIKLVNPANYPTRCKVNLCDIRVEEGSWHLLYAKDEKLIHTQNVNRKEIELIKPELRSILTSDSANEARAFEIELPGQSVHVLVFGKLK